MSRLYQTTGGLPWLVAARNEIQSLMLQLYERWDALDANTRQFALGAAFSLWRAVFLIADEDAERRLESPGLDAAARGFLQKVIETNAIGFGDDRSFKAWTGGYYVNNAIFRVSDMQSQPASFKGHATLRDAWNDAFQSLDAFVSGTISGTASTDAPKTGEAQRA